MEFRRRIGLEALAWNIETKITKKATTDKPRRYRELNMMPSQPLPLAWTG